MLGPINIAKLEFPRFSDEHAIYRVYYKPDYLAGDLWIRELRSPPVYMLVQ